MIGVQAKCHNFIALYEADWPFIAFLLISLVSPLVMGF